MASQSPAEFIAMYPETWPGYGVAPHAVQIAALQHGMLLEGAAYYMEQGLGKSRTALMDFANKVANKAATRLVIECPNSFKGGWKAEIEKWGFDFDVLVYEAGMDMRSWLNKKFEKPPVVIINFDSVRVKTSGRGRSYKEQWNDAMYFIADFIRDRKCMLVIDESIQISTHDAAQTKAALRLSKYFDFIRVLSGKPQKQGPHDLWSQMRAIRWLDGFDYFSFKNAFCKMGGYMGKKVVGVQNEDILQERLAPVVFRATKADWTDLPPKLYTIREYKLTKELRAAYNAMEEDFILWLRDEKYVTIEIALSKYIKLAQIQAGFIYDDDGKTEILVPNNANPRLRALKEFVDDELVGKAVIAYKHKPVKMQLEETLGEGTMTFIHGGMTTEEVEEAKRRFNEDPTIRYICVTKSAKYGHTLLGDQGSRETACSTMIFYENTYALDDRSQLEDRSHRHGQLQEAMSYVDFAGTELDRDMIYSLQMKNNLFEAVFGPLRVAPR